MADDIDRASDMQQIMLDSLIAAQRSKTTERKPSPAECLNGCGELPLPGGSFCCRDCKEDFDYRQQVRRSQGLA